MSAPLAPLAPPTRQIHRLAVLDRGQPAARVLAAIGDLNRSGERSPISTVIVLAEPVDTAWYAREADDTLPLGPSDYLGDDVGRRRTDALNLDRVIARLTAAKVDAVWLGSGVVGDHAGFAERAGTAGITLIGHGAGGALLVDRYAMMVAAGEAGVPVPAFSPPLGDLEQAVSELDRLGGSACLVVAGLAGRRGLYLIGGPEQLQGAFSSAATAAASAASGDGRFFLQQPPIVGRRVDVDVVADHYGTVWPLEVRDVGLSRGGQVLITEGPCPGLSEQVQEALRRAAVLAGSAVGLRDTAAAEFVLADDGRFVLIGIDTHRQMGHAVVEERTGLDLVRLRLDIACGSPLGDRPPTSSGVAVETRLLGADQRRDNHRRPLDGSGRLSRLTLPVGTGVRFDAGLREGDRVSGEFEPVVATVTSWGRDRAQALLRLRRALEQTSVVVDGVTTNRTFLIDLLADPRVREATGDPGWVETFEPSEPPDPLALLAAAIEAYDIDQQAVDATFHARAARGRPEQPEEVGSRMTLVYAGAAHHLRVDKTGMGVYRVGRGAQSAEVRAERIDRFERRLAVGARRARATVVAEGDRFRLEIDGVSHVVVRQDGVAIRAGWPAFVVSMLVSEGQHVAEGDPVAVLESMKMESSVLSPIAGVVSSIDVMTNAQVEAGAALLHVRSATRTETDVDPGSISLSGLDQRSVDKSLRCEEVYRQLSSYLLGFDLDPGTLRRLRGEHKEIARTYPPADATLLSCEDTFLDLFADLAGLFRPRSEADAADDDVTLMTEGTQEHLLAYLQWLDPVRAGTPDTFVERLTRALARYGVEGLTRTRKLESAVVYMYRSFQRVNDLVPIATSILERRLRHSDALAGLTGSEFRARLDHLALATQGRFPPVADLARDVRYRYVDQPILDAAVGSSRKAMKDDLAALAGELSPDERQRRIEALVAYPHPLRPVLLASWQNAGVAQREALLEVSVRRFYRICDLQDLRVRRIDGELIATAQYDMDATRVYLVSSLLPLTGLPAFSQAIARHLAGVPASTDVVVDVLTWAAGQRPNIEATAHEVSGLLKQSEFGRPISRFDISITSSEGPTAEHFRTQHLTYHQSNGSGFAEDPLMRNIHPMLAARLEMWRLREFALERLASAEDVYLFRGVAHADPKDARLFALAEVRDLTPVKDPASGAVSFPMLERMGLRALAAMRSALAGLPPRERPVANRLVLAVRPAWDIAREDWYQLATSVLPLARGAGLQKVVLRVQVPDGSGGLTPTVLHVEGVGAHGVTVREAIAGSQPIQPLNAYQRNVLTAARFGVPYPYEIIRTLAPEPGTTTDLPPGHFIEHDLDADRRLVAVDRPPGGNSAHLVVGLITTFTDRITEGMTRVAILSDPTKGLGNLAEPECRRINAALELAARMQVPVEWFAVSSGALISMDSGTENMDWIADTLRRLIEFTQGGGEVNIIVTGINVGGQPYWNAEATMLMHTKGILIMTPSSAMVLTGKQALDFSGGVSADDNLGIGGYDRVMGVNGQAQYWAPSFAGACQVLMRHYELTYVVPGERFPRRHPVTDPVDRDVREAEHASIPGSTFTRVGDIFDAASNGDRKKPFDMRSVMRAVADAGVEPLERWARWRGSATSIVWDTCVDGIPVCMLGLESRTLVRRGFVPADGPPAWTSGTLFPQSSRKTARAINATSGNRPLVVLANLSGFDGSPESLRHWQLEYGAEIGRAVTNFRGPIVFVVVSRYHGGAFVVFSKALNPDLEIAAVEGSFASVIGGAPAAATVFVREVKIRTEKDSRVVQLREALAGAAPEESGALKARLARTTEEVRSQKLGEVAEEFNSIHTIERALRVGSVDRIIPAEQLRPYIADALARGMAREEARRG